MKISAMTIGLTCLLVACGGAASPVATAPMQASAPASADTAALAFLLVPSGPRTPTSGASLEAFRSAMIGSGYKVVVDPHAPHDAQVLVSVSAEEQHSMFVVAVNGKRDVNERVRLTAAVTANGQVIDELSAEFVSENSQVSTRDVSPAVNALGASPRIASHAKELRSVTEAHEIARREREDQAKARAEKETKQKERIAEEGDWNRARVTGCSQPSSLNGCDAVRTYLAKYPSGAHAEEAEKALKVSEPKMADLQRDENAWKGSGAEDCLRTQTRDACEGVEIYATKFPVGLHRDEAQASLRGVQ